MVLGITFSIAACIHTPVPHVVPAFLYYIIRLLGACTYYSKW